MSTSPAWHAHDPSPDEQADALVAHVMHHKPRPIEWANLTKTAETGELQQLQPWVHWLVLRYRLDPREVPPCWAEHGELVEELSALRTARHGAYAGDSQLTAPADWHQTLAATRQRLGQWLSRTGCRPGNHRLTPAPEWLSDARMMVASAVQKSGRDQATSPPAQRENTRI